jgi:ankyrin repeat protein
MINTTSIDKQQISIYQDQTPSTSNTSSIFHIATNIQRAESSHARSLPGIACRSAKHTGQPHSTRQEAERSRSPSTAAVSDDVLLYAGRLELTQRLHQWRHFVRNNHWEAILTIIRNGIDAELANTSILTGRTALMQAACAHETEIVAALINVPGIRLDIPDRDGDTALTLAAYVGSARIVAMLHKADVNTVDIHGDSALLIAANKNHIDVVNILLQAPDIDPNRTNIHGLSPLHCAALDNHHQIVRKLLKLNNINVNAIDENGHSALMLAAANGHFETVELLCNDRRTDIALRDPWQKDALTLAGDHPLIIDLLLRYTDVNQDSEHNDERSCHSKVFSCMVDTLCGFRQTRTRLPDSIPLIDRRTEQQAFEDFP